MPHRRTGRDFPLIGAWRKKVPTPGGNNFKARKRKLSGPDHKRKMNKHPVIKASAGVIILGAMALVSRGCSMTSALNHSFASTDHFHPLELEPRFLAMQQDHSFDVSFRQAYCTSTLEM